MGRTIRVSVVNDPANRHHQIQGSSARDTTITQSSVIPNIKGCATKVALAISLKYFYQSPKRNAGIEQEKHFSTVFFSYSSLSNSKHFE